MVVSTLAPESRRQLAVALERERDRVRLRLRLRAPGGRSAGRVPGKVPDGKSGRGRVEAGPVSGRSERELQVLWDRLIRERLIEVVAALQRLAESSYGICEACGRPIETRQLQIRPWSRFCSPCAQGAAVGSPPGERSLGG